MKTSSQFLAAKIQTRRKTTDPTNSPSSRSMVANVETRQKIQANSKIAPAKIQSRRNTERIESTTRVPAKILTRRVTFSANNHYETVSVTQPSHGNWLTN